MLELYLRKLVFTYSASGPFTENKEGTKKLKEQENHDIIVRKCYIKLVFNMTWLMEILKI